MGSSPQNGKKPMWFPFKKNSNQELSLLSVSSKIYEMSLYDSMFKFFTKNSLILQNQLRFKPGNSCTNQFVSTTHQIYKSFDDVHEHTK